MSHLEEYKRKMEEKSLTGDDVVLFARAIEELSRENEDIQELLEDMKEEGEEFKINLTVTDTNKTASMWIKEGKFFASEKLLDEPTLSLYVDHESAGKILRGELGLVDAYKKGLLKAEGSLGKVAGLALILNIVGDELGVL